MDITTSTNDDMAEVVFSAETPAGEAFLHGPTQTVPVGEARALREAAEAQGLKVGPAMG
jgi:hypothetical protein